MAAIAFTASTPLNPNLFITTTIMQMGYGFERGAVDYIAAEFSGTGLIYHFVRNGQLDHAHGFDSVLEEVLQDPENIDIVTD